VGPPRTLRSAPGLEPYRLDRHGRTRAGVYAGLHGCRLVFGWLGGLPNSSDFCVFARLGLSGDGTRATLRNEGVPQLNAGDQAVPTWFKWVKAPKPNQSPTVNMTAPRDERSPAIAAGRATLSLRDRDRRSDHSQIVRQHAPKAMDCPGRGWTDSPVMTNPQNRVWASDLSPRPARNSGGGGIRTLEGPNGP
jgi:hypothetical protein